MKAFQDYYSDNFASCFGCGRLNEHGLHIKSYWDGEESVCRFQPEHYHTGGFPGNVITEAKPIRIRLRGMLRPLYM